MNKISELHGLPKGEECEISGVIIYEQAPKPVKFGVGFNQFVVVEDIPGNKFCSVGVNISLTDPKEGFLKGEKIIIQGKVDKYPDRTQKLTSDGTYPMKTSLKAHSVERFKQVEDFPIKDYQEEAQIGEVMDAKDLEEANKPNYIEIKTQSEREKQAIFEAKDLISAKKSAAHTIADLIIAGKIELKNFFVWSTLLVDFFYNTDDAFAIITEANLMKSGLIEATKLQVSQWILERIKGTQIVLETLCEKPISTQTLEELKDTAVKVALAIGG